MVAKLTMRRLHAPSADELASLIHARQPAVISGLIDDWPALAKWSLDYLMRRSGHRPVTPVRVAHLERPPWGTAERRPETTLEQYLRGLDEDDGSFALAGPALGGMAPEAVPDLGDLPTLAAATQSVLTPPAERRMYLGGKTFAPMHFHSFEDVVSFQLVGRKRFVLFSPEHSKEMVPTPWYSQFWMSGRVDLSRGMPENGVSSLPHYDVTIEPGEGLFIPIHWWHVVYGIDHFNALARVDWAPHVRYWTRTYPAYVSRVRRAWSRASAASRRVLRRATGRGSAVGRATR